MSVQNVMTIYSIVFYIFKLDQSGGPTVQHATTVHPSMEINTVPLLIVPVSAMCNTMSQPLCMLNASLAFVLENVAGVAMELVFDLL